MFEFFSGADGGAERKKVAGGKFIAKAEYNL